jgi:hypothetical protein
MFEDIKGVITKWQTCSRHEMEIKQNKIPSIDIKSSTNIKFIVFILKVIVYGCVIIYEYDDDVHSINWLFLPSDGLLYMINFLYLKGNVSIKWITRQISTS